MNRANHINSAIIVDDEEPGRIMLRYALKNYSEWQIAGEFNTVSSARAYMDRYHVDVVFLDIQMPKENGIALARSLSQLEQPPLIIFVTAYNAHAVDAFEVHALDYLLKPFNPIRFAQAIERAGEMLAQRRGYAKALQSFVAAEDQVQVLAQSETKASYLQHVIVRSVGEMECVLLELVHWISSASNYVELHVGQRAVMHRMTLSKLETLLNPAQFVRVHRTVIVSIDQMQQLSIIGDGTYSLKLFCGDAVPVSERYVENVRAVFSAIDQ